MASQQSIKVCCLVHGQSKYEVEALEHGYSFPDDRTILHSPSGRSYTFDQIFHSNTHQSQIYNDVAKPIVSSVLCGYNGTILVHGQTSSDKAYTMEGDLSDSEKMGIIPRVALDIFTRTKSFHDSIKYEIKISYNEIYLEKVYDLFDDSQSPLQVYDDKNGLPFVVGGKEILVKSIQELMGFFNKGKLKRHAVLTDKNEIIARSHAIFQIVLTQENILTHEKVTGKLLIVELAGNEQICSKTLNDSITQRESKCINMSLSVVSRVILLLAEKKFDGIPYRESVLTRLLKESLGGNSQTALIVCIRPSTEKGIKRSLEIGCRAKIIKNNFYMNMKLSRKKLNRIWEKLQRYISSTNRYISGTTTELRKWRNGEVVPTDEWITLYDYREEDDFFSDSNTMDSSFDTTRSVHEQSDSQILSNSSLIDTSNCDLNDTFNIPDCEDFSGLQGQIEIVKKQYQQLVSTDVPSHQARNEDINQHLKDEIADLKEELKFYKVALKPYKEELQSYNERNETHFRTLKRTTHELESQKNMRKVLLKMGTEKNETHEAQRKDCVQDINKSMNNFSELLNQKNSVESCKDIQTFKRSTTIDPSISEKMKCITKKCLKATLHAENAQKDIRELSAQNLFQVPTLQNQKLPSEYDIDEKMVHFPNEIYNFYKSHATEGQAETLPNIHSGGLDELLNASCIQAKNLRLYDQLRSLNQACELQNKIIAEVSKERDVAKQAIMSLENKMIISSKLHDMEKQTLNAKFNKISCEAEQLKNKLENEHSTNSEHHSSLVRLREKIVDVSKIIRNLKEKIKMLENNLDMERNRNKENIARMKIMLLEKGNTVQLLVTKLCCSEKKNRILFDELQKVSSRKRILEEESKNLFTILKNYSNKYVHKEKHFDKNKMADFEIEEPKKSNENYSDFVNANNNEVFSLDLTLRQKLAGELKHLYNECENVEVLLKTFSIYQADSFGEKEFLREAIEYFQNCEKSRNSVISTSQLIRVNKSLEAPYSFETLPRPWSVEWDGYSARTQKAATTDFYSPLDNVLTYYFTTPPSGQRQSSSSPTVKCAESPVTKADEEITKKNYKTETVIHHGTDQC